jgi:hypothetical protein
MLIHGQIAKRDIELFVSQNKPKAGFIVNGQIQSRLNPTNQKADFSIDFRFLYINVCGVFQPSSY